MFAFQVTALAVIKMTWQHWVIVVGFVVGGGLLFYVLSILGQRLLRYDEDKEKALLEAATRKKSYDNEAIIIPE